MKCLTNSETTLELKWAIANCLGAFMFRGKSKIIVNFSNGLEELNYITKTYGISCYDRNTFDAGRDIRKEFLLINCHNNWEAVKKEINLNMAKKFKQKPKIDYILFIVNYPIIFRIFLNVFYIISTKILSNKSPLVHATFNSLYEINLIDDFSLVTPRKLDEPWLRTTKNCIKKLNRITRLIVNPLVIILEVDYG